MPKRLIKRYLPTPEKIRQTKALHFLGDLLHEPNLWHINRHSVSKAFFIGLFWAFIPMPFQMVPAAFCAVRFNCNLPLSVALVWLTNPLTMPPVFYFSYRFGALLLGHPPVSYEVELTSEWLMAQIKEIGLPLYVGSVANGFIFGGIAYLAIEKSWRAKIRREWKARSEKRQARRQAKSKARTDAKSRD